MNHLLRAAWSGFVDGVTAGPVRRLFGPRTIEWIGSDGTHHEVIEPYAQDILRWVFDKYGDVDVLDAAMKNPSGEVLTGWLSEQDLAELRLLGRLHSAYISAYGTGRETVPIFAPCIVSARKGPPS